MRILFLHNNCPAQYRYLAPYLASDPDNTVVFGTMNRHVQLPNIRHVYYAPTRYANPQTHHYLYNAENAILHAQAVYRMALQLKKDGFVPDIICAHSGWGPPHFMQDVFPNVPVLAYFEWYYNLVGSDFGFLPNEPNDEDTKLRIRMKNISLNFDLINCYHGISPTQWQYQQLPSIFHQKITCLHDGVDTDFMSAPRLSTPALSLPNATLTADNEIITYVARGMEPFRGFPQFLKAVEIVQQQRPKCHVIIVGEDKVCYGKKLENQQSYKQLVLKELSLDLHRIHFMGLVTYEQLRHLFYLSKVHVYLTVPFILSWSLLEAMACKCCVIASNTEPVREVITHEKNGFLVDFFDTDALAKKINDVLNDQKSTVDIRKAARKIVIDRYAKNKILPKQKQLIESMIDEHRVLKKSR